MGIHPPLHPVLPPPPPKPRPVPTTPQWEATKAKMALLNLSDAEIEAGIDRLPAGRRAALFDRLTGTLFPHHYRPFHEAPFSAAYEEKMLRMQVDRAMLGPMPLSSILLAFSGSLNLLWLMTWWIGP